MDAMMPPSDGLSRGTLLALLLLTLLTALPPLLLVPPTTKSDETYHWAYATYVAQNCAASLPLSQRRDLGEAHQPPPYYARLRC